MTGSEGRGKLTHMSIQEIVINEYGAEEHPSFIVIRANVVTSSPGARLFDSDIVHPRFVMVQVLRATRKRDLNTDWIHAEKMLVEVHMSLAQWGAFVSSFGDGSGVPVTLRYLMGEDIPSAPFEPRLKHSIDEVKASGDRALEDIKVATDAVTEAFERGAGKKEMRELIRTMNIRISQGPGNMKFAAESLSEHAENVVAKARADIEGMVDRRVAEHGLTRGDIAPIFLEAGGSEA